MPHVNSSYTAIARAKSLDEAVDAVAREPEDDVHTPIEQTLDENIGSSHRGTPESGRVVLPCVSMRYYGNKKLDRSSFALRFWFGSRDSLRLDRGNRCWIVHIEGGEIGKNPIYFIVKLGRIRVPELIQLVEDLVRDYGLQRVIVQACR